VVVRRGELAKVSGAFVRRTGGLRNLSITVDCQVEGLPKKQQTACLPLL